MRGFSLVELSIVLVILGLLTGGILAGQSLIRASELRAVTAEYQRYVAATQTFRNKYFALPGDITNATKFWGTQGACPGDSTTPYTTAATCDGDGDGMVEGLGFGATNSNEMYTFFQHLANAGLIEGRYTGVSGGAVNTYSSTAGTNVPRSKLGNSGWTAIYSGIIAGDAWSFAGDYGHALWFGGQATSNYTLNTVLKPEEAWNIDTKLDDGMPGKGFVIGHFWDTCTLAATNADITAAYNLSNNAVLCSVKFIRQF